MLKSFLKFIVYTFSMQAEQDRMDAYILGKKPKTEQDRLNAVREYFRVRGGY